MADSSSLGNRTRTKKQEPRTPGDIMDYVHVDWKQVNPMRRIAPVESAGNYDAKKYAEMLLDVTETILGVFRVSRTQQGFQHNPRSFLEEFRGGRGSEIVLELEKLDSPQQLRPRARGQTASAQKQPCRFYPNSRQPSGS